MQEYEKNLFSLIMTGIFIGLAKVLVSEEKITFRVIIGRSILGSATSLLAGIILITIPNIPPLALVGIGSALGICGSTVIEIWLKKNFNKLSVR